jgi:hypothetical protein
MRIPLFVCLCLPATVAAQEGPDYYARLGAVWSSRLAQDEIAGDRIETTPGIAPMLVVGIAVPAFPRYRVGLEAALTSGSYSAGGDVPETDLGTIRTLSASLGIDGPVHGRQLRWRGSLGVLKYLPASDANLFLRGGPLDVMVGAGLDYRRAVSRSWDLIAALRYDFHRFTTDELEARGFAQAQPVHRVSLSVGIARGGR